MKLYCAFHCLRVLIHCPMNKICEHIQEIRFLWPYYSYLTFDLILWYSVN